MADQIDDKMMQRIVPRLLAGESSESERAAFEEWLAEREGRRSRFEEIRRMWEIAGAVHTGWNTRGVRQRVLDAIDPDVLPMRDEGTHHEMPLPSSMVASPRHMMSPLPSPKSRRMPNVWSLVRTAATIVIGAGVGAFALRTLEHGSFPSQGESASRSMHEVATKRGQRATLQLSDGTHVMLGVASHLRYPEQLTGGATRDVYLDGDAYFDVAHDAVHPFRVHAGTTVTRVLGTRFGVRAYAEDRIVRVVVAEGRVALAPESASARAVVLAAGDLGVVTGDDIPTVRHGIDVQHQLAWTEGQLVFTAIPVIEVARELSRWYNIDIEFDGSFRAGELCTMSLRGDETPAQVLRVLASAVGARLERHGMTFLLSRGAAIP